MAATITIDPGQDGRGVSRDTFTKRGKINLGVYATGGVAVSAQALELVHLLDLDVRSAGGYSFSWDKANGKVIAWYADYDAGADGALIQVANAVNLTAVEARFRAEGR